MFFKGILIPVLGLISSFWSYNTTPVVNLVSGDIVQDYRYTPSFSVQGDVDFIGSYYSDPVTESGKLSPIVRYLATYGKSVSEVPYLNIAVFSDDSSIKSVLTSLQ